MRTAGWLVLSVAIVAGLTVAVSRAAEDAARSRNRGERTADGAAAGFGGACHAEGCRAAAVGDHHRRQRRPWRAWRDVRSAADEDMGHIVDVIVDLTGRVRAAVIDFGGFLGVGSRKIVVDWNAMRFGKIVNKKDSITLELTKAQVAAAPEYKEDTPMVVLGASGSLQPLQAIQ